MTHLENPAIVILAVVVTAWVVYTRSDKITVKALIAVFWIWRVLRGILAAVLAWSIKLAEFLHDRFKR